MKRIYVGVSSCIGFDYGGANKKTPLDKANGKNPILYGSMGMMLLYDEIWFGSRGLCPYNMRDLTYVRFLDEEFPGEDIYGSSNMAEFSASQYMAIIDPNYDGGRSFENDILNE